MGLPVGVARLPPAARSRSEGRGPSRSERTTSATASARGEGRPSDRLQSVTMLVRSEGNRSTSARNPTQLPPLIYL